LQKETNQDYRRNTVASRAEGVLHSIYTSCTQPYLPALAVRMGADDLKMGLITALPQVASAVVQVPASFVCTRYRRRRKASMLATGLLNRFMWVPIAFTPFLASSWPFESIALLLALSSTFSTIATLFWTDLMADVVPPRRRGRDFGVRNALIGAASVVGLLLAGKFLTTFRPFPLNFTALFVIGFIFSLGSWFFLALLRDPGSDIDLDRSNRIRMSDLWQNRTLLKLSLVFGFWNFAVSLPGALWTLYMIRDMGGDEVWIGLTTMVAAVSGVAASILWGKFDDRYGAKSTIIASSIFIAAVPAAFVLLPTLNGQILLNLFSGGVWAGFNLAVFTLLLADVEPKNRLTYIPLFNTLTGVATIMGTISGSLMTTALDITLIFYLSSALRLISVPIIAKYTVESLAPPEHLRISMHLSSIIHRPTGLHHYSHPHMADFLRRKNRSRMVGDSLTNANRIENKEKRAERDV
jgi:MFS family permease